MNVLVCDEKGPLSMAGVMGGAESEVTEKTRNILLEARAGISLTFEERLSNITFHPKRRSDSRAVYIPRLPKPESNATAAAWHNGLAESPRPVSWMNIRSSRKIRL